MPRVHHEARSFADGFLFLEAPKWRDGALWVSDVFGLAVYTIAPDGTVREHCKVPGRPAGQDFLPDGRHIVVSAKDGMLLDITGGRVKTHADLSALAVGPLNDFAVDAQGRIFVGDFGYDYDAGEAPQPARLYRVDPDGTVQVAAEGVNFPNGSVVIDGQTLLVNETWVGRVLAYDLAPDGTLSGCRVFADVAPRQPDGMCADAEGAIWVGSFGTGEFLRIDTTGTITDIVPFSGAAISCTLGGADGHTLFLTTFDGPHSDIATDARKSAVYTLTVPVPALGYLPT